MNGAVHLAHSPLVPVQLAELDEGGLLLAQGTVIGRVCVHRDVNEDQRQFPCAALCPAPQHLPVFASRTSLSSPSLRLDAADPEAAALPLLEVEVDAAGNDMLV